MIQKTICPPQHTHATKSSCYCLHKCRCDDCIAANRTRQNYYRRQKAYGRWVDRLVDGGPAREHINMLRATGMGSRRIAELAGVHSSTIQRIICADRDGTPCRLQLDKAERILGVSSDVRAMAPGTLIPARGAHRRIQALVALGWTVNRVGKMMGHDTFGYVLRRPRVTVHLHLEVIELYDRMWSVRPPATTALERRSVARALALADANGWVSALGWDDIDEDDLPSNAVELLGEPVMDAIAVELAIAGAVAPLTKVDRDEAIRILNARGLSDPAIANRLGCSSQTILRTRGELQISARAA